MASLYIYLQFILFSDKSFQFLTPILNEMGVRSFFTTTINFVLGFSIFLLPEILPVKTCFVGLPSDNLDKCSNHRILTIFVILS